MTYLVPRGNVGLAPWAGFRDLEDRLSRIFDSAPLENVDQREWMPSVDLHETEDAYILEADLPGMKKEDINLSITDGVVTLKGNRTREDWKQDQNTRRVERSYGAFQRSFRIPGGVDSGKVEAAFEQGVLKVKLPKPESTRPRQIDVQVK